MIDSLTRMTALVRKEFLHLIRDPRALALVLALPAMQLLLFAWAISFDVRDVPTVVWDADRTPASRAYAQEYSSGGFFRVQGSVDSEASLDRAFERGWAQVAIVIPAGFQRTWTPATGRPCSFGGRRLAHLGADGRRSPSR